MRPKVEYDLEDQIREGLGDTLLIESQIRDSILENKYELELDEERYPHMNRKLGATERVTWLCDQAGTNQGIALWCSDPEWYIYIEQYGPADGADVGIPEPGSLALLGLGVIGALMRKRK